MMLNWLASSCTSVCAVMVGRTFREDIFPAVFVSLSVCYFAALITELAVIALVNFMSVR